MRFRNLVTWAAVVPIAASRAGISFPISKAQLEFFENKIRPVFVENCYPCHSPANGRVKGGLELDWKGGWEKGGESGAAIVPGDPEKSLLIKAVRYTDPDLQMPPKGDRLTQAQVNDLVAWVKTGAPDPRQNRPAYDHVASRANSKDHWAFKPVRKPAVPPVKAVGRVRNDLDRFVLAKLEANGLTPNPPADKRTLLRRVYYDLIGLPPTPAQVQAFLEDHSAEALAKVVDELLASPHYGERWGRHWLDLARYSDSKGQSNRRRESSVYPDAWTYRDYVINAFNEDGPYDRFILEQLAADKLNLGTNRTALAALGFLTLGDHFNGNANDIINDRIDVTTKAFLGLTVSCARCHDHKFDPIPQADYYSLHGIFGSCVEPLLGPEISARSGDSNYEDYLRKRKELDTRVLNTRTQNLAAVFGDYKRLAGVYLFATRLTGKEREAYLAKTGGDTNVCQHWEQISLSLGRRAQSIFGLWNALTSIPEAQFATVAPRVVAGAERNARALDCDPRVLHAFRGRAPRTLAEAAAIYGALFASADPALEATLSTLLEDALARFLPQKQRGQLAALREQSDLLEMGHPGAPARATVLYDSPTPKDSPIFIRGEAENRGPVVPRRFLEVLSGPNRPVFKNGSGRLELAMAIADRNNPLTARVLVNRVWQHHFGDGFVITPDDLGNQSTPPSHPELLDYLAARFMEDGWSLKKLHKFILLSATYQQSSQNNPVAAEKDPFNRLLWRANVRRLEFEPLRDSILYFGGQLDLTVGGHPVDLSQGTHPQKRGAAMLDRITEFRSAGAFRRTIYGYVDRADLLEELNTFDFANPAAATGKRYETTVPQQALFLMNSPLVIEQVRKVVAREEFEARRSPRDKIQYLYGLFFQRLPTDEEIVAGEQFVRELNAQGETETRATSPTKNLVKAVGGNSSPSRRNSTPASRSTPTPLGPWQEYAHALLLSNEAAFVD
jgi:mono/diheme cytochrome c family protein